MNKTRIALVAATLALVLGGLPLTGTAGETGDAGLRHPMAADLAHRDAHIHWPDGFSPEQADLFAHNETRIDASCDAVWGHIADAANWPKWYPNGTHVQLAPGAAALAAASVFRWRTFGFDLESRMVEFEPAARMGWFGYAPGKAPNFYHTWYLEPRGAGCRVVTEEVGKGLDARAFRQADESTLHRGHDLWLAGLKWVSETPAAVSDPR